MEGKNNPLEIVPRCSVEQKHWFSLANKTSNGVVAVIVVLQGADDVKLSFMKASFDKMLFEKMPLNKLSFAFMS